MQRFAENLWIKHYPLNLIGGHQGRTVTIIRLANGALIIHSTGPFSATDVEEIRALGRPAWMVDSMLRHDTFSKDARAAFPDIPYLVPENFPGAAQLGTKPLYPPPAPWAPDVRILLIDGMPAVKEYVFLHVPSRTLIVADLVFNFAPSSGWTSFMRRYLMGVRTQPDSALLYPMQIKDRAAYNRSLKNILNWDFERIIVGHGKPVEGNAKERLRQALANKGMLPK